MKQIIQCHGKHPMRSLQVFLSCLLPWVGGLACSSPDLSGPPSMDLTQLPWTLSLSAHAITMSTAAPYDTLQMTAAIRTVAGTPLADAPAVTFSSTDSSVQVSATGLLTALGAQTGVRVIATAVVQGIRVADTAVVNVTAEINPPVFAHLHVDVPPGDSTKWSRWNYFGGRFYGVPSDYLVRVAAQDAAGTTIPNSLVLLSVSDITQAIIDEGCTVRCIENSDATEYFYIQPTSHIWKPLTVRAEATVYGKTLTDSLPITMIPEAHFIFTIGKSTPPESTTPTYTLMPLTSDVLYTGACVWWDNVTGTDSVEIVFDDPTAASPDLIYLNSGGGNIAAFPADTKTIFATFDFTAVRSRCFQRPGTFRFHSVRTGIAGQIIVQDRPPA